jgi:hypothetical protein
LTQNKLDSKKETKMNMEKSMPNKDSVSLASFLMNAN